MNWSSLTKEQKQWIFLGLIVATGVVYAVIQFGVKPLRAYKDDLAVQRGALEEKIQKAESLFRREGQLTGEYKQKETRLDEMLAQHIPPAANTLVWATEQINDQARLVGVKVEAIVPVFSDTPWASRGKAAKKPETPEEVAAAALAPPPRRMIAYAVQITLHASFSELMRFTEALEKAHPYSTISSVSVSGQDNMPTSHSVTLQVCWPIPEEPLKIKSAPAPAPRAQEKKP